MNTMKHLLNWLNGFSGFMQPLASPRRYHIEARGFAQDARRLRGDFKVVGSGLRKQLKNESADYRAR